MNKQTKKNKGITLIALVITIIVLLILAGISIATLTGDEGILTKTTDARNAQNKGTQKEQIKLSYNSAKVDSKGKEITETQLQEELRKYDSGAEVTKDGENFKIKFTNGNIYTLKKDGTIEGPTNTQEDSSKVGKLATEVLKTNESGTEDYEKSPYVKYNGITCRVLYNDETHGLQIISADNIKSADGNEEKIILGYGDTTVETSDFNYDGDAIIDDNFLKAATSYNKVVDTLNEKAKSYKSEADKEDSTENKIAIDARSLGSIATLEDRKFQLADKAPMYPSDTDTKYEYITTYGWNGKFKNTDANYEEDVGTNGQIQKLDLNATSETWLASREVKAYSVNAHFCVKTIKSDGTVYTRHHLLMFEAGGSFCESFNPSYGIRPVFLISPSAKIIAGNGETEKTAYELGILR